MERLPLHVQPTSMDLAWNDPEENLRRMDRILGQRLDGFKNVPSDAQLFVFPELTLTGFVTKEPRAFALETPDPVVARLAELAHKYRTGLVAGFPEANFADPARPFNAAVLVDPEGRIVGSYRKMHLFTVGQAPESAVYAPGEAGRIVPYRGWKIGFAICFDLRFPQLFVEYGRAGADLIVAPSCWIGGPHKSYQFRALASAHAILAQSYVAAVNRSGKDPFYEYDGSEYVFSPFGESVYRGAPAALDATDLAACRQMAVRSVDREKYIVGQQSLKP